MPVTWGELDHWEGALCRTEAGQGFGHGRASPGDETISALSLPLFTGKHPTRHLVMAISTRGSRQQERQRLTELTGKCEVRQREEGQKKDNRLEKWLTAPVLRRLHSLSWFSLHPKGTPKR